MSDENQNGLNKVEDMKRKIFSRNYETRIEDREGFVFLKKEKVPEAWKHEDTGIKEPAIKKNHFFRNFFIFSILLFVGASIYLLFNFFVGGNEVSNENIEISVLGNTFTGGGEELPLVIEIVNKNTSGLELADLVVEYPKGSTLNSNGEIERLRKSLGVIPAGSIKNEDMKVVLYGEQGSIHEIKISLEYRLEGSNAIFLKDKFYKVTINSTPINLAIDAPTEITPNQDLSFKVKAVLNDNKVANGMLLKLDYPFGFEFTSAVPAPSIGNNVWDLSNLKVGEEREIVINGVMVNVYDGEAKIFHAFVGPEQKGDKTQIGVVFNSLAHNILIKKPFVEAKLYVNNDYKREYSVSSRNGITGTINWFNNLNTPINDLEIKAKFGGNAFDVKKVDTEYGFLDSSKNTIIWDKNTEEGFDVVRPLSGGSVRFRLLSPNVFTENNSLLLDPSMSIEISISGKQALGGNITKNLESVEVKNIKIFSDVSMLTKVAHVSGPLPPKSEQETTYKVTWSVANTSNNVSGAKVVSSLPARVNYKNVVLPNNENLTYDPATRVITWNIGNLPRGTGLLSPLKEVSFQVSINPSLSEVGDSPVIAEKATLTGYDDFAKVDVGVVKSSLRIPEKIVE